MSLPYRVPNERTPLIIERKNIRNQRSDVHFQLHIEETIFNYKNSRFPRSQIYILFLEFIREFIIFFSTYTIHLDVYCWLCTICWTFITIESFSNKNKFIPVSLMEFSIFISYVISLSIVNEMKNIKKVTENQKYIVSNINEPFYISVRKNVNIRPEIVSVIFFLCQSVIFSINTYLLKIIDPTDYSKFSNLNKFGVITSYVIIFFFYAIYVSLFYR